MNTLVSVTETGESPFQQSISAGTHRLIADEPVDMGGQDTGPAPFDLLMAGLGACTSMTLRMYANLKKIPLEGVTVDLSHSKREVDGKHLDCFSRTIHLSGELSEEQRQKFLLIANKCPVHKALQGNIEIHSELAQTSTGAQKRAE